MGKYKKGERIKNLDELMSENVIFFVNKPLNKAFYQNWNMHFAELMISNGFICKAELKEREERK